MILQIRKYPQDKLYGKAIMRAISSHLVEPVRKFGDDVHAFRVVWRTDNDGLAQAWDAIVSQRHLCDRVVARTPSLQMFVSCMSGMFNTGQALQEAVNPVFPAISYWAVFDDATPNAGFSVPEHLLAACPSAQVKRINLRVRQEDDARAADSRTLFIALKDHNSDYLHHKIAHSLVACGGTDVFSQPPNAKVVVLPRSKYLQPMPECVSALNDAGLCIQLEVFEGNLITQDISRT